MKKLICAILTLCLLASAVSAVAEGAASTVLNLIHAASSALAGDAEAAPADSIDSFRGTWTLTGVAVGGQRLSLDALDDMGYKVRGQVSISGGTLRASGTLNGQAKKASAKLPKRLSDGVLHVTLAGESVTLSLTESGALKGTSGGLAAYFSRS